MGLFKRAITDGTLLTFTVFLVVSAVNAQLISRSDTQQWTDVQFAVPLSKSIDFNFGGTLRLGRDFERPVDERIGFGATFKFGDHLSVTPNYQYIGMQPFRGRRVWENRLSLPINVRFDLGKFRLSDRNLFERRIRHPGINATRYRNRIQLEHPIGPPKIKLSIYVSEEVFYDWSFNAWVRNRAAVGVTKVFNKAWTQDFYYLRQNDSHSIPGDLHVIGTTLRLRL
ncbi:MAG TPA: DUF2490 domain-containing protein [Pyrinomonadaceae bacterium]|nr:DUF2490 domain-containing protein [Pyrinomonadaceae bacterium]